VFEDSHDLKNAMGRPSKKVVIGGSEDNPPITSEDEGLEKEAPQDPNTSNETKKSEGSKTCKINYKPNRKNLKNAEQA